MMRSDRAVLSLACVTRQCAAASSLSLSVLLEFFRRLAKTLAGIGSQTVRRAGKLALKICFPSQSGCVDPPMKAVSHQRSPLGLRPADPEQLHS